MLDSANARVYVDGNNEITYLPREIEIATRLGQLCTSLSTELRNDAEAIARRLRVPSGRATHKQRLQGAWLRGSASIRPWGRFQTRPHCARPLPGMLPARLNSLN